VNLAGLLERLLHIPPVELEISTGWLCERHKELAGDLFPDWAGRYRDLNVQVGQHTPPPYYEVPTYMRMFCDDLRARLHHLPPESAKVQKLAAFLAWIHPFKDFNGRIGRVLLAALLYKLALPHVETAPLAGDVRQPYLSALRAADEGDLVPLTDVWLYRLAAAL
jgi:Fic family protein